MGLMRAAPASELIPKPNIMVASSLTGSPPVQEQMTVPTTALTKGTEMVKPI